MKYIYFTVFFLFFLVSLFSQNFTINYKFGSTKYLSDSTILGLQRPFQNQEFIFPSEYSTISRSYSNNNLICNNSIIYKVTDTSCAYIADGYGHEIIIIPGDTMNIEFSIHPFESKGLLNNGYHCPWLLDFSYSGKNKYIYSLFDSLVYNTGSLNLDFVSLETFGDNTASFLDSVTQRFYKRNSYLGKYCQEYNIPATIQKFAFSEIKSSYLLNLIRGFDKDHKYSERYLKVLNSVIFNDKELFFKTALYHGVAITYIKFFQNLIDEENPYSVKVLLNNYTSIKNTYTGQIRDYLITNHLNDFLRKKDKVFDSLLNDFKLSCFNANYFSFIDSVYKTKKDYVAVTLEMAYSSFLTNKKNEKYRLSKIFKGKPLLVDCWASWCSPCIYQLPYTLELEKKYDGKVDFVYISFDKKNSAWISKMNELNIKGQHFLLERNFKSDFAAYFEIGSIPRYLLFDKTGKLITAYAPRPSQKDRITRYLDKMIK